MDLTKGILLATSNPGKLREIRAILGTINDLNFFSLLNEGFSNIDVKEDGNTFRENALIKAKAYGDRYKIITLADDSGIEVDNLDGAPGVNSARYAGKDADDKDRVDKLLQEMKGVDQPERSARFRCVICLYDPATKKKVFSEGVCEGSIAFSPRGDEGFGYDPIFIARGYEKTMAEIEPTLKNKISHRAIALSNLKDILLKNN